MSSDDVHRSLLQTIASGPDREHPLDPLGPTVINASPQAMDKLAALSGEPQPLELGEQLGVGGLGEVYLARQHNLHRDVAVKVVGKPWRTNDEIVFALIREAWLTGTLEHPNIVPIYDIARSEDGLPQVVMQKLDGVEWSKLIRNEPEVRAKFGADNLLDWNLDILLQVVNTIRFAHSRHVVHLDLKPANVMIGSFGQVYVVDWGNAVSLGGDGGGRFLVPDDITGPCGTPGYMAPELLTGDNLDERTDVYLLGSILYEILAGTCPHRADSAEAILAKISESRPKLPADCPAGLARIALKAMAHGHNNRYQSLDDLYADIVDYRRHRGSEELAADGAQRLAKLHAILEQPGARRDEAYRLFGECRFAFHESLEAWPDNPNAQAGWHDAVASMSHFELAHNEPRAAHNILSELSTPPADEMAKIELAIKQKEARITKFHTIERDFDPDRGRGTRIGLSLFFGSVGVALPLTVHFAGTAHWIEASYGLMATWSFALFTVLALLFAIKRESMLKSVINRRLSASAAAMMLAQICITAGGALLELPHRLVLINLFILWFTVAGMLAICVDRRLSLMALGFLVGFFAACAVPSMSYFALGMANVILVISMVVFAFKPADDDTIAASD